LATTRSRPRGREQARPASGGVAAEHATKIYGFAIAGVAVVVAFLALTGTGHVIDAATQHFMLFYAGVFALIALCASTGLGLVATDRVFLNAGHRVFAQSAHRAASFGAVVFLVIHIVTEILAQRVHALDSVVPFLSPFRTFYIGLGTIAADLILLVFITGIMRGRFNSHGKAWRWRAIHYTAYASFVFGIWHGLLAGRPAKPYVDWSYGLLVALVLLALAVRIVAHSLRPKENLSRPAVDITASSASAPMRAAAMFAQFGMGRGANTGGQDRLMVASTSERVLSAPVSGGYQTGPMLTVPQLQAQPQPAGTGQTYYEPGYEGPARYVGAPRGPVSGPMPRADSGPMPRAATGPIPRAGTGPIARAGTGPIPAGFGPMPRDWTGPMPVPGGDYRSTPGNGPWPRNAGQSGPMPRAASGPIPRAASGPIPRGASGPIPQADSGPMPRAATGPQPRTPTGPIPSWTPAPTPTRSTPWPTAGPSSGPMPRAATGPITRPPTGPQPQAGPRGGYGQPSGYGPPGGSAPQRNPRAQGGYPGQPGPGSGGRGRPRPGAGGDGNRGQAPWDGGLPEPDPAFKYREPGPGMPGYRGSRDYRYGGDAR
jgi:hypothetical protein